MFGIIRNVSWQLVQMSHFQIRKTKANNVFKSLEITFTQRNEVSRQTVSYPLVCLFNEMQHGARIIMRIVFGSWLLIMRLVLVIKLSKISYFKIWI